MAQARPDASPAFHDLHPAWAGGEGHPDASATMILTNALNRGGDPCGAGSTACSPGSATVDPASLAPHEATV